MELSVVLPTHARPTKLAQCLRALAAQDLDQSRYEVLVGLDGPDEQAALIAADVWSQERPECLRIIECPRAGANATRNRLLNVARGRYAIFVNDDVIPAPDLLSIHLREQQAETPKTPAGVMIAGNAPWRTFDDETLFDRIVRETSMIFFYDQMFEPGRDGCPTPRHGPDHDWGYRHWWTLNASAPLEALRAVGGFLDVPLGYGYDDIELAFRLHERFKMPVLFRPEARAVHDHRYHPREVLDREQRLGESAWRYAERNPSFARDLFGRDVRSSEEITYSRDFLERERPLVQRLEKVFLEMSGIPASAAAGAGGGFAATLITIAYQQHLLLKRWYWRSGLLAACGASF